MSLYISDTRQHRLFSDVNHMLQLHILCVYVTVREVTSLYLLILVTLREMLTVTTEDVTDTMISSQKSQGAI